MSSETPCLRVPRHPKVWWSRYAWRWPLLFWLAVAAFAVWLYQHSGDYARVNGIVEVTTVSLSPLEDGSLLEINVIPGQVVEAGEVIARLDASLMDQEISVLEQELKRERANELREYTVAQERLREEIRRYSIDETDARIRLEVYESELDRLQGLVDEGFVTAGEIIEVRAEAASLRHLIDYYAQYKHDLQSELANLQKAHEEVFGSQAFQASEGYGSSQLTLLRRQREQLTLEAPHPGIVSLINREPGEVIRAGDPVVEIIIDRDPRIIAFMNETDVRPIAVGDVVNVESVVGGIRFEAQVQTMSPNIVAVADRASPLPQRMVRGRRLELIPIDDVDLTPGASMKVILPTKARIKAFFGGPAQ